MSAAPGADPTVVEGAGGWRPWIAVIVVAGAAGVAQTFGRFTYSLLLTDVRDDLGLSNTVAGGLGTLNLLAYLTATVVVSLTVSRIGLVPTTRIGIVASALGIGALAWSPNLAAVAVGQVIAGLGGAAVWVTAPALASASVEPRRRGLAIGLAGTGIGVAMIAASAVASAIDTSAWRAVYVFQFAVAVVIAGLAFLVIQPKVSPAPTGPQGIGALGAVRGWRALLGAYAAYGLALALFINFLVASLRDDSGYSPDDAAFAFSAFGVGAIAGGAVFGRLSDRFGRRAALVLAFGAMVASSAVVPTGLRPWATVAAFGFGLAFIGVPTAVAATIRDDVDDAAFGAAFGAATLAFGAALMVGPQLGGILSDRAGSFDVVFATAGAVSVVGLGLAMLATRPRTSGAG